LVLTLGLSLFSNAALLYFRGLLLRGRILRGQFSSAFWGAVVISIVSVILNTLTGMGSGRGRFVTITVARVG